MLDECVCAVNRPRDCVAFSVLFNSSESLTSSNTRSGLTWLGRCAFLRRRRLLLLFPRRRLLRKAQNVNTLLVNTGGCSASAVNYQRNADSTLSLSPVLTPLVPPSRVAVNSSAVVLFTCPETTTTRGVASFASEPRSQSSRVESLPEEQPPPTPRHSRLTGLVVVECPERTIESQEWPI